MATTVTLKQGITVRAVFTWRTATATPEAIPLTGFSVRFQLLRRVGGRVLVDLSSVLNADQVDVEPLGAVGVVHVRVTDEETATLRNSGAYELTAVSTDAEDNVTEIASGAFTLIKAGDASTTDPADVQVVVTGPPGPRGLPGADGAAGADGVDGADGTNGTNGADGADGAAGADGTNGVDGADGTNGADGADGPSGVVSATAPLTYDAGTRTVALSDIAESKVIGLVSDLTGKATTAALAAEAATARSAEVLAAQRSSNLSDLASASTARTNLGLGSAAVAASSSFDSAGAAAAAQAASLPVGDASVTNARTPTAHASSHTAGGTDAVTLAESQVTGLVSDLAAKESPAGAQAKVDTEAAARAAADSLLIPLAQKAAANGVATLDSGSKIPTAQMPAVAITDTFPVASQVAMLALAAERGDVAIRSDILKSFILASDSPSTLADWKELLTPGDLVSSVNGRGGVVTGLAEQTALDTEATSRATADGLRALLTDPRFTDSRTPTAHAASHASAGSDALTLAESQITGLVADLAAKAPSTGIAESAVTNLVSDLAAKETPAGAQSKADAAQAASQPLDADLTAIAALSTVTYGRSLLTQADAAAARTTLALGTAATANKVAAGAAGVLDATDATTTNSRTPTAHAASHASAGSDALTLAESQITGLVADLAAKAPLVRVLLLVGV